MIPRLKLVYDGEEIISRKILDENVIFVFLVALLLIVASGGGPYTDSSSLTPESLPCHQIKGEVVFKEIEGGNHYLYVELFIDEEIDGYIVKVSEVTLLELKHSQYPCNLIPTAISIHRRNSSTRFCIEGKAPTTSTMMTIPPFSICSH